MSDAQCNCSPSPDGCPAHPGGAIQPPPKSPYFIYQAWCHMVWNIPSATLGQLFWLCSHPASCALPRWQSIGSWKVFGLTQTLLSNNQCVIRALLRLNPKHSRKNKRIAKQFEKGAGKQLQSWLSWMKRTHIQVPGSIST